MNKAYRNHEIRRDILKLAWPSIVEQTLIMMVGLVSTIFVGRIGKEAMAAVAMINMLITFFQAAFAGLSTGSTVIIARLTGEGDLDGTRSALVQSLIVASAAGLLIVILGYLFSHQLMVIFLGQAEPAVLNKALEYYNIVMIGLPFMVIDMVISGSLRGAGDTKTPMYVTVVVNIINLVLSSILIFGIKMGGRMIIPALGVTGTAISVTVARICGGAIRIAMLYSKHGKLILSMKDRYKIDIGMLKRIVNVGLPAFLEQAVMQGGFLIMQVIMVPMGTVAIAAYQVGVNINSIASMPVMGFAIAVTTMVGQYLGSFDYKGAEAYAHETAKMAVTIITCLGILMLLFAQPLALMYTSDEDVIKLSLAVIRIFAVTEPFVAIMTVCAGVLRGAGDIKYIVVTAVVGLWCFRIMTAYILISFFKAEIYGIMAGICVDFTIRAAMYSLRMRTGKWKYLRV